MSTVPGMVELKRIWNKRKLMSHKGDNGKVLIIGGSKDYVGALALAGLAALRTGVDWVTIAAPENVAWAINCLSPDLITRKYAGDHFTMKHVEDILSIALKFDAVLIGNGIGTKSNAFIRSVIPKIKKPLVIDADALKAVKIKNLKNALLTPHAKEFEICCGKKLTGDVEEDSKIIQSVAGSNVILLKGHIDIIANSKRCYLNKTGNPGMTVAGTGDVLAGLCVGFLALGLPRYESACLASHINGRFGDALKREKGYSFIASDLVEDMQKLKRIFD